METNIFNIQKYSIHDGPGIRTLVFFKGCPLRCEWCSNPESQSFEKQIIYKKQMCSDCKKCLESCPEGVISASNNSIQLDYAKCKLCFRCIETCPSGALSICGQNMKVDEIVSLAAKDKPFYRKTGGGVTISGGEPFANIDFLIELLKGLKVERIHTAIETTGYTSWDNICRSLEFTDLLLYDLKHTDSHKHEVYTGVKNEIILENLKMLDTTGCEYWVRVPIIPTFNDDMRTLSSIFDFISCLNNIKKAELLPYHRLGVGKYAQLGMEYKFDRINTNSTAFLVEMKDYLIHKYPDIKISIHE